MRFTALAVVSDCVVVELHGMGCAAGLTNYGIEGIGDMGRGSKRACNMEGDFIEGWGVVNKLDLLDFALSFI